MSHSLKIDAKTNLICWLRLALSLLSSSNSLNQKFDFKSVSQRSRLPTSLRQFDPCLQAFHGGNTPAKRTQMSQIDSCVATQVKPMPQQITRPCRRSAPVVLSSYRTPAGTLQSKQRALAASPMVWLRLLKVWCDAHALLSDGGNPVAMPQGCNRVQCCPAFTPFSPKCGPVHCSSFRLPMTGSTRTTLASHLPAAGLRDLQHALQWRLLVIHAVCHWLKLYIAALKK